MLQELFLSIVQTLEARDEYFQYREDGIGRPGLTPLQKCTVALRQLAYGTTADMFDEYLHVGETTGRDCLKNLGELWWLIATHICEGRLLKIARP